MKIYISGQITGLEFKQAELNFAEAYFNLVTFENMKSYNIVNPLNVKPIFGIKKWLFFMISDVIALKKCDAIALQTNWEESKGAFIEHFIAKFIFRQKVIKLNVPKK